MPPDSIISLAESERMVDGLPMADAQTAAESQGLTVREVRRDGEDLLVTQDYSPTRINVATSGGQVEAVVSIG